MGTNISQGASVCNTSRRGTLLFFRNFIFIFFLIKWCIICSLFWRTASAKNLKISSNNQMTKVRAVNLLIMLEGILHYFSHIYRILV